MTPKAFIALCTTAAAISAGTFLEKHRAALLGMSDKLPEVGPVFHMLDTRATFPTPAKDALLNAAMAYVAAHPTPEPTVSAKGAPVQSGNSQGGNSQGGNSDVCPWRAAVEASKGEIAARTECRKKAAPIAQKSKGTYGWQTKCAQTRVIFSGG